MEVYVDDLVVKSKFSQQHPQHLAEVFVVLRDHRIKLNPTKCTFGVTSGHFLGYLVMQRGMEANPDQIRVIQEMTILTSQKEVQELIRRIVALSYFLSWLSDRHKPIFVVLRRKKSLWWDTECTATFEQLKEQLAHPPILLVLKPGEILHIYLSISKYMVSSVVLK